MYGDEPRGYGNNPVVVFPLCTGIIPGTGTVIESPGVVSPRAFIFSDSKSNQRFFLIVKVLITFSDSKSPDYFF